MINKRKLVLLLLCLTICILALSACGVEERLMEHFPMWEEAQGELSELKIEPSIELEFQGIDFETYTTEDGEYVYDEVLVHLKNTGDKIVSREKKFGILYLYNGKWYVVYQMLTGDLLGYHGYDPKTEEDLSFLVPTGLFEIAGQYKLYIVGTGFCDIDIVFSPNDV